ncbi:MAG: low temperature requirement protein A, partial [Mycobacterium sp.]
MTVDDGNAARGSASREPDTDESRETDGRSVGNLELFFDLTFVFAMSQVTHLMLHDISWQGFGRGVLALLALWWAWVCYAWLTNMFEIARVIHTTLIILAMAAMLIAVIALPTAFTTGALVFGLALLAVRLINAGMFIASASRDEAELASAIRRLVPGLLIGPALIVAAAFVDSPYRELLWVAAAVDFGSPLIAGTNGLRVVPSHFIERHGAVIIIALGETIISLGAGASESLHHPGVLGAVVLGVLITGTLWWTYFGLATGAEERLRLTPAADRARLARDAYSYLHLPLVAGVVFFALGARVSVEHI